MTELLRPDSLTKARTRCRGGLERSREPSPKTLVARGWPRAGAPTGAHSGCGDSSAPLRAIGHAVSRLDRLIRLHFLGYTCTYGLLGAATAGVPTSTRTWFGVLATGALFHVFGIVLNDLVDLPVDRSNPARVADPLVRGVIAPTQALLLAVGQVPMAFAVNVWLGASPATHAWLAAAFAAMGVYDVFGKRCPMPPLTDAAQGLSWTCMAGYGAAMVGEGPTFLTAVVGATGLTYTLLINGIHGGMRDLSNDYRCGARTTALWLGIRPTPRGGITVPRRADWYCWTLLAVLLAIAGLPLVAISAPSGAPPLATSLSVVAAGTACTWGMFWVLRPNRPGWGTIFRLHLVVLLLPMLASVLSYTSLEVAIAIVSVFFGPLILLIPQLLPERQT